MKDIGAITTRLEFRSVNSFHNFITNVDYHFRNIHNFGNQPNLMSLYTLLEYYRMATNCNIYLDFWKDADDDVFNAYYDKETIGGTICNRKYSVPDLGLGEILIVLEFPEPKSCKGDKVMYKKEDIEIESSYKTGYYFKNGEKIELGCVPIPSLSTPAPVKVQSIETYNDRVLIVRFSDGTFSKAMCEEDGAFDFSMLFTIAYMKRILGVGKAGHKAYHKLIDDAHKIVKKQAKDKAKAEEEAARKRDIRAKRKKRAEKKAQKKMDKFAEAVRKGMNAAFDDRKRDMAVQEDDLK